MVSRLESLESFNSTHLERGQEKPVATASEDIYGIDMSHNLTMLMAILLTLGLCPLNNTSLIPE